MFVALGIILCVGSTVTRLHAEVQLAQARIKL
jgi:hypothetical protein